MDRILRLLIIFVIALFILKVSFTLLEAHTFPVVSDFDISSSKNVSVGWTEIYGSFHKNRNCRLEKVTMYFFETDNYRIPIQYIWLESPVIRGKGLQYFGPWHIQVPESQIENVQVVSKHVCHRLYDTMTTSNLILVKE